jgi:hypothetical protein
MGSPLSNMCAAALVSALACASLAPASATPMIRPGTPWSMSDVVPVVNSKTVRRDGSHHEGGAWKKRRHRHDHRDGARAERRHHRSLRAERRHHDGRARLYRPRATPKYAYDAYGNRRVYDGDGWNGDDRWEGRRDGKRRHRVRRIDDYDFGYREPSRELRKILTTVPDLP